MQDTQASKITKSKTQVTKWLTTKRQQGESRELNPKPWGANPKQREHTSTKKHKPDTGKETN